MFNFSHAVLCASMVSNQPSLDSQYSLEILNINKPLDALLMHMETKLPQE